MNDVKLKSIILGINIILSLLSCKGDNIDYLTSTDNKSEITVKGGYNNGGDYIWNYNIKPKNKISQPKNIKIDFNNKTPFSIYDYKVDYSSSSCPIIKINVTIKKEQLKESIDLTKHNLIFSILSGKEIIISDTCKVMYPLPQHPRLLVKSDEIEKLKVRFNHDDFKELRESFDEQISYNTDGIIKTDKPDEKVRQKMEALALSYLLTNNVDNGKSAIRIAINYLSSYSDNRKEVQKDYHYNLQTYEAVFGASMVYDWCYNLLSEDDKSNLIKYMKKVCMLTEYGIPDGSKKQYLSGHYGEYAPTVSLARGIAIFDEEQDMLEMAYKEQTEGFAPSRNRMIPSETHHQGAQYIHVRGSNELLQHFILDKLNSSPYNPDIYKMTYRAIYGMIPQSSDMDGMPEGDCHNHVKMGNSQLFYLSANLSEDPFLQDMSRKMIMNTEHQSARVFIYHNPDKQSLSIEKAPLSRFFPSPSGIMIARTGWDMGKTDYDSETMVVLMNMREYSTQNHTHMDLGHFSIYYKGHLALDAGIYQGKDADNGWGKWNYVNYYSRTIAHNSLLVYDPNEPKPVGGWKEPTEARDGGQFFKSARAWDNSDDMFKAGPSATILAHEIADGNIPDYTYFKGDITEAYKVPSFLADYPSKVETVRRSFVFLNHKTDGMPGSLIVLDKVVSTNPSFKKTWLLHTQNKPYINGSIIESVSTQKGRNGKLVTDILLPDEDNINVELIGGSGKEYWVDGHNYGTVTQEDAGCWRVELSPRKEAKSDNFLNVIQTLRADKSPQKVNKVLSDDGQYVAIEIGNNIVAQNLELSTNDKPVKFNLGDNSKTYKVIITDLKSGTWNITAGTDRFTGNASVNGVLTFESHGGKITLSKK